MCKRESEFYFKIHEAFFKKDLIQNEVDECMLTELHIY